MAWLRPKCNTWYAKHFGVDAHKWHSVPMTLLPGCQWLTRCHIQVVSATGRCRASPGRTLAEARVPGPWPPSLSLPGCDWHSDRGNGSLPAAGCQWHKFCYWNFSTLHCYCSANIDLYMIFITERECLGRTNKTSAERSGGWSESAHWQQRLRLRLRSQDHTSLNWVGPARLTARPPPPPPARAAAVWQTGSVTATVTATGRWPPWLQPRAIWLGWSDNCQSGSLVVLSEVQNHHSA